jgi:hypothetical protein
MSRILLLVFLLVANFLCAQKGPYLDYTHCSWNKIQFVKGYLPDADTGVVFVSTRNYFPGKDEFLSVDYDTSTTLHYFNIYFKKNSWVCVPRENLQEAMNAVSKKEHAVVFVEGFGKTFPGNVDRATRFARCYNVTTIMFDWPTFDPRYRRIKNFKMTRRNSQKVAKAFSFFLSELDEFKNKQNFKHISIILHSMGNLLLQHSVKNNYIKLKDTLFENIVLNAACVPQRKHKQWVEKINIQQRIYITRNNHDKTLNGAKLITFRRQLGERARGPYALNATYINFSAVLDMEHNYFLYTGVLKAHPNIKAVYNDIFFGRQVIFTDKREFFIKRNLVDMFETTLPKKGDTSLSITP